MTKERKGKPKTLSREILGLVGISGILALVLFLLLSGMANAIAETYCFDHDIILTEFEWIELSQWIFGLSLIVSVTFFSALFLFLLSDRIAYIRKITAGIHALQLRKPDHRIPLEGNNELTQLAEAINTMTATQQQLQEKEQALQQEKEQLSRTLSHDIRTPLTSILSYSEYLALHEELNAEEQKKYLVLLQRKAEQIRDLTEILLDGGKRNPEHFKDARLLMAQLAAEFEEGLEERFSIGINLSGCPSFSGTFDVQELRRVFDNLSSNIQKYADPSKDVELSICITDGQLLIRQENAVLPATPPADSYQLGIKSIQRILHNYSGQVNIRQDSKNFVITMTFSEF